MKIIPLLLWLIFTLRKFAAIDLDDITLSNCTSESQCDDTINTVIGVSNSTGSSKTLSEGVNNGENTTVSPKNSVNVTATTTNPQTLERPSTVTTISTIGPTINTTASTMDPNTEDHSGICPCDVTGSICDSNCCCDTECNKSILNNNGYHQPKIYDSRYCYKKNFLHRNNTQFILERLASNLFCIAYDNLPPIYGMKNPLDIKDRKAFEDARHTKNPKKYSWDLNNIVNPSQPNISNQYRKADGLWKLKNKTITVIELPQTGFTGKCKVGKILKYGESMKWSCMQTDLSNNNTYLFSEAYDNFTVISSPHLFNMSYINVENQTCPEIVCIPVRSHYCVDSKNLCLSRNSSFEGSCTNGDCRNVIKRVRYKITLNGTCGIQSINISFELTNTSQSFYQSFEVTFEGNHDSAGNIFSTNDTPGYKVGNPIPTGFLVKNKTDNVITEHINVNKSNIYLTLPISQHNGDCNLRERYIVGFGEDIRLRCNVKLTIDKFASDTCVALQNKTMIHLLGDETSNRVREIEKYNYFVSKTGDISNKDTLNWTEILFDKIGQNVVTGQIYNNHIRCSGLVTSLNIDILYTIVPKFADPDNYNIAGISVTFFEPVDMSWPKCLEPNCNDVLKVTLLSLVTFTDISTPSMYYYAGGPNLDITLPYDFFYPFMSGANINNAKPAHLFIQSVSIIISFGLLQCA